MKTLREPNGADRGSKPLHPLTKFQIGDIVNFNHVDRNKCWVVADIVYHHSKVEEHIGLPILDTYKNKPWYYILDAGGPRALWECSDIDFDKRFQRLRSAHDEAPA